jgi:GntR family transcriptional regulator, transcriptional repressor for pyruvate dehydrogenase complex
LGNETLASKSKLNSENTTNSEPWTRWDIGRSQSTSSRIIEQVRNALFRGELKPGDFLGSESNLAQYFEISRVPVRDAFQALQAMGIIEVRVGANGGARIAVGDPSRFSDALAVQLKLVGVSVEEMFDAQIAIEVMATELAAKRATERDFERLRVILGKLQSLSQKPLTKKAALHFTETSMRFHQALVDAAHNRVLAAQFKALRFVLEPIYARRTTDAVARRVLTSHKSVLDALVARDVERACSVMRRRLQVIRAHQLLKTIET